MAQSTMALVRWWSFNRANGSGFINIGQQDFWNIIVIATHLRGMHTGKNSVFSIRMEKRVMEPFFSYRSIVRRGCRCIILA